MSSPWLIALLVILVAIAAFLLYASSKPDTFSISRSRIIPATPEALFPLIDGLRAFNRWNPFLEPDPAVQLDYYGPDRGAGSGNRWSGNSNVGAGSVEVVESRPSSNVVMRLDMQKPLKASNRVEFSLRPVAGGTDVTWTMSGRQPLMLKVMSVFINCDDMSGRQFDKGLAKLAEIVAGGGSQPDPNLT